MNMQNIWSNANSFVNLKLGVGSFALKHNLTGKCVHHFNTNLFFLQSFMVEWYYSHDGPEKIQEMRIFVGGNF